LIYYNQKMGSQQTSLNQNLRTKAQDRVQNHPLDSFEDSKSLADTIQHSNFELLTEDCINVIMVKLDMFVLDFGVTKGLRELCKRRWKGLCKQEFPKIFESGYHEALGYFAGCLNDNKLLAGTLYCYNLHDATNIIHVMSWFGFNTLPYLHDPPSPIYKALMYTKTQTYIWILTKPTKNTNSYYLNIFETKEETHIRFNKTRVYSTFWTFLGSGVHLTKLQQQTLIDAVLELKG